MKQIDIFEAPNQSSDFTAMRLGEGCSTIVLPLNLLRRYCIEAKLNFKKKKIISSLIIIAGPRTQKRTTLFTVSM